MVNKSLFCVLKTYLSVSPHFYHILFGLLDGVLDVEVRLGISNGVPNTDGMTCCCHKDIGVKKSPV